MKTTIHILTLIFALNFTLLFASDPKLILVKANVKANNISFHNAELAPMTPKEAYFDDYDPLPLNTINRLAPITPKEATFEDSEPESSVQFVNPALQEKIIPVTPKEAEFEDFTIEQITGIDPLAPFSPIAAPFEE